MSDHISTTKVGGVIPVRVEGGVPLCPHCGDSMTEVEPGVWQCTPYALAWQHIRKGMAEYLDRLHDELTEASRGSG